MSRMLFLIVALVLAGCRSTAQSDDGSAGAELTNTHWKLTEIVGGPPVAGAGREAFIRLVSRENRLEGRTGCNSVSGGYRLDGDRLTLSAFEMTELLCLSLAEQEKAFLTALDSTAGWRIAGRTLELRRTDGVALLRFEVGDAE